MNVSIFEYKLIQPFEWFGLTGKFWTLHIDTLVYTWTGMFLLFLLALLGRWAILKDTKLFHAAYEKIAVALVNLNKESFKEFNFSYFSFVNSLLFFTLFNCLVGIVPFMDEATKDLNTTLAIALVSFFYVHYQRIRIHGIGGYLAEYATPNILFVFLHVIGELSKIASMTFRLFGNILGGSLIFVMVIQFVSMFKAQFFVLAITTMALTFALRRTGITHYSKILRIFCSGSLALVFSLAFLEMFFGIFEGLIQSFVLTMLTSTYLAMASSHDEGHKQAVREVL